MLENLVAPISFNGDECGQLRSLTVQRMELGEPDASGYVASPYRWKGAFFDIPTDLAILGITRTQPGSAARNA